MDWHAFAVALAAYVEAITEECPECYGEREVLWDDGYGTWMDYCRDCDGTGRVQRQPDSPGLVWHDETDDPPPSWEEIEQRLQGRPLADRIFRREFLAVYDPPDEDDESERTPQPPGGIRASLKRYELQRQRPDDDASADSPDADE